MVFKDIFSVSTNASGTNAIAYTLGIGYTTAIYSVATVITRLSTMAGLYRQYVFNSVKVVWIPCASTSSAGTVCMGVDQAVTAAAPTSIGQVYHHVPSSMFDIKAASSITWSARAAGKNDFKYTTALSGLDEDALSFGVFQAYCSGPASTQIGYLEFIVDVSFTGPC